MRKGLIILPALLALSACSTGGTDTTETTPAPTTTASAAATTTAPAAVAPDLTETYACGFGFYTSDAEQTAGLFLFYNDFDGANSGNVPTQSQLTDETWDAQLQFGTDLFANWCDDVIEPGEPEPVVDETWNVSGHVEITSLPEPGTCGPATATITGAAARNTSGEVVPLGDLEVSNPSWGCFAG